MAPWRRLIRGFKRLRHPGASHADARDEVEQYFEAAVTAHQARGLDLAAARRAARLELGSLAGVTEELGTWGWEHQVETFRSDLRYAARRLRHEPGFTLLTVLILALGIGASTAILSAVRPILLEPLPYPGADRLVALWDKGPDGEPLDVTYNTFQELRARTTGFDALAVFLPWRPTLIGPAEPERLEGQRVSWEYLRVLGVAPALGADFQAQDDRPGSVGPVILSDRLWRRRFGADPGIIGRPVTLDGTLQVVAGVMPANFEHVLGPAVDIWTPLQYHTTEGRAWGHHLRLVGRMGAGVSVSQAARELTQVAANPTAEFPRAEWAALELGLLVRPLRDDLTAGVQPALLAIVGAVALVLVIACVNVTNLLLARGIRRQGEFAVRATLGAGAARLARQALTETVFLTLLGGLGGMMLAALGVRTLVALSPVNLPRLDAITLDRPTLAIGWGLTLIVGLVLGVLPARAARRGAIHSGNRHVTGRHRRVRSVLIVTQVALALVLLVGSGLLLRSMQRLFGVDLGFDPANLLTMQVQVAGPRYADDTRTDQFFAEVLAAVQRVPGVAGAALTSQLPLSSDLDLYGVHPEPSQAAEPPDSRGTFRYAVSPSYFATMSVPLRQGRPLLPSDRAGSVPVAVVSESFARRHLPGLDPLGNQLRIGGLSPLFTIVGVVGDVKQVSLALDNSDAVYVTPEQWSVGDRQMSLVVRATGSPGDLIPAVRRAIWSVDKDQPIVRTATMGWLVRASAAERRFALIVFEAFALSALLLAAAGLYGVLAGTVNERTHELGVRSALGATPRRILGLIIHESMILTGIGVLTGFVAAALASRGLQAMLFGVSPLDPVTYLGVIVLLAIVALVAAAGPAWRAAHVPPATPLRAE